MTAALVNAVCARHAQAGAVEICSRCGAFLCGECVLYVREVVPTCAACRPFVENEGPASRAAWAGLAAAALGLGLIVSGFLVRGRGGLWLWGGSLVPGVGGLALCARELLRVARNHAPRRGKWLARLGLAVGTLYGLVALALAAGFALFLARGA